jgi:thiol-disulfide isomerase/thioredoxin
VPRRSTFVPAAAPPTPASDAVKDAIGRASKGTDVLVYVGASWCEPCQRFHEAVVQGRLDGSLPNITFVEFDLERDRDRLAAAGYTSQYVPLFAVPAADGRATDRRVEGAIKGDGAVPLLEGKLKALLGRR